MVAGLCASCAGEGEVTEYLQTPGTASPASRLRPRRSHRHPGGSAALVTGVVGIAEDAGVSQTAIGFTLTALGASLPELVTDPGDGRPHRDVRS